MNFNLIFWQFQFIIPSSERTRYLFYLWFSFMFRNRNYTAIVEQDVDHMLPTPYSTLRQGTVFKYQHWMLLIWIVWIYKFVLVSDICCSFVFNKFLLLISSHQVHLLLMPGLWLLAFICSYPLFHYKELITYPVNEYVAFEGRISLDEWVSKIVLYSLSAWIQQIPWIYCQFF